MHALYFDNSSFISYILVYIYLCICFIFRGKRAGTKRTESSQEKLKAKKRRMEKAILNITPAQIKATKAKRKFLL
jgi:hypothetical protein